jgi:hypothetical protein
LKLFSEGKRQEEVAIDGLRQAIGKEESRQAMKVKSGRRQQQDAGRSNNSCQ